MKKLPTSNGTGKSGGVPPRTTAGRPSEAPQANGSSRSTLTRPADTLSRSHGRGELWSGEGFPPACLRRGEVAALLQVSVSTVHRLAVKKEIRKVKFLGAVRFLRAEVEDYIKRKAESAKAESGNS